MRAVGDRHFRSFNPRLPLLGGDADGLDAQALLDHVSIHASRCWEAMHHMTGKPTALMRVSIHASRCWEAMPERLIIRPTRYQTFQSTPPVAGRRCCFCNYFAIFYDCFNPRLPLLGGDAGELPIITEAQVVSIHASRCWEAMPPHATPVSPSHGRFNPRLPLLGGDAGQPATHQALQWVSIHASRCWEAMRNNQEYI